MRWRFQNATMAENAMAATTDNPAGLTCPELRKAERAAEAINKKRRLCSVLTHLDANAACNAAPAAGNTTLCVVCQQHVPVLQAALAQAEQQRRELRAQLQRVAAEGVKAQQQQQQKQLCAALQ